jgi:2-desacetyl-2-hydroxyethyl bacteriochlorophyllide A dehydrogenase
MKAAVLQDYFKLGFEEIPEPEPAPSEVKIKVAATGICGSEIHAYKGTYPFRVPPSILGHEMAGDVVAVGSEVTGVAVGDRVTLNPQRVCHKCDQCLSGNENRCVSKMMLGVQGWPGSFAEYVVAPEELVYKLPDHLSYEEGTMAEPLAVGVHAVRISGLGPGSSAVVLGGGTIGLSTLLAARAAGATTTVVTDAVDFNLRVARELGATATVNVRTQELQQVMAEATGGKGADYAFVTVGLSAVMNQAIQSVKKGGRVVAIALFEEPITIKDTFAIVGSERVIQGSMTYTPEDVQRALEMIASGEVEIGKLITQRLPISDVQRGFQIVDEKLEDCVKVVLKY